MDDETDGIHINRWFWIALALGAAIWVVGGWLFWMAVRG